MLVDDLAPAPHARTPERALRLERGFRKGIVKIFVDHGRLGNDLAVVNERRHLAVGIDREVLWLEVIAVREAQEVALVDKPFLLERQPHLDGSLREAGVVEFEHLDYCRST